MTEEIPKQIQEEFTITSENMKYPTYPDEEYQKSISEDENLNNYSSQNIQKTFDDFFSLYESCKNKTYDIISTNLHNFQEYCQNLNEKSINYIFYFNILEKMGRLVEAKYYKKPIPDKEIFCDEIIYECINNNKNFSELYKKEYKSQNEINKINQELNPMIEKYNKLLVMKNELGNVVIRTIKYLIKYLFVPFEQDLIEFQKIKIFFENNFFKTNNNEENEIKILNVILHMKKMKILEYAFYNSASLDKNDICNLDEKDNEWIQLKKILFRLIPKNIEEIKNQNIEARKHSDIMGAVMSNVQIDNNNNESISASSLIFSGMKNYIYYKANENKAKIDSRKFQIKTNFDNFPNFMKLFKSFKSIFSKFLPSVEFRRKIYVLKELPPINRSYIEKLINFMKGEDIPVDSNNNIINNLKEELPLLYKDKVMDKSIKRNYVSVTILNNKKLYFKDEQEEGFFSSMFNKFKSSTIITQVKNEFKKNTILIAVHGGGFIGSSTFLHERYLRKWVKELDIPIFGINYSLAPKYKYPEGINDVFQAYMWILNHAKEELNMDIKHIILYGDSAGANIILSLNSLLIVLKEYDKNISENIILPELLLPFYPVTHVSIQSYSNSLLLTLGQQMLSPDVLKYMCNQYLGEYPYQDNDMFLNPIKLNDFILDRMNNKIRIFFGSSDILRDDSIRLLHVFSRYNNKNGKNKIDVRGYDIFGLGHGFNGQRENVQKISRDLLVPEIVEYLRNIF